MPRAGVQVPARDAHRSCEDVRSNQTTADPEGGAGTGRRSPAASEKIRVAASRAISPGWLKSARASKSVNRVTDITRLSGPHRPRSRVLAALAHSLLVFRRYRIAGERIWKRSRKTTS